jgi:hypothetical protein
MVNQSSSKNTILLITLSSIFLIGSIAIISIIPCPSEPQFIFYKILLAISIAGIASIVPGFMRVKYKNYVSAGGALAVFVFVLTFNPGFIANNPKCKGFFNLNVQLYGDSAKGIILKSGEVKVVINGRTQIIPVQLDGKITLEDLPMDILGKQILITPQIEDYHTNQKIITLEDQASSIDLVLEPIVPNVKIEGNVFFRGRPLKEGIIIIDGQKSSTDEFGSFSQILHSKEGTNMNIKIFYKGDLIFNSTEVISIQKKEIYIK